jgi:pimeloyl-ACP methyl ester carboxylesterase
MRVIGRRISGAFWGDNRGVGQTDKPQGPYTSAMMADDYAGLMDALGIKKAHIVGCSMGGIIAQQLALRHPDKVKSAILMCTWARLDRYGKAIFDHLKHIKAHLSRRQMMNYVQLLIFTKPFWDHDECYKGVQQGQVDAAINPGPQPLHALEAQAAACQSHNVLDELKNIKAPCLVIGGKNDIFTPRWMAEELAAHIPNNELHLFDTRDTPSTGSASEAFNAKSMEFLQKHSG